MIVTRTTTAQGRTIVEAREGPDPSKVDGASRDVDGMRNASVVMMAQPHQPRVPLPLKQKCYDTKNAMAPHSGGSLVGFKP
uniref:Uncharacterized protein n=1 Tax=Tanacetum cinerariifolium TaxID=118510 RepID=A0A699IER6_TANCI|nr:hypothetical protein [Tanacetum cinerariifolium]